eukprot:scaffold295678_cov17-Prasinocladus_malaysianus.AAC.1
MKDAVAEKGADTHRAYKTTDAGCVIVYLKVSYHRSVVSHEGTIPYEGDVSLYPFHMNIIAR